MTFGDLLRKLIEQSGNSISAAARGAEIERTTLQKALSGERTLPYPAMKKLAAYLRLTPHEQKIFCEYYDMQIQGPAALSPARPSYGSCGSCPGCRCRRRSRSLF